METIIYITLTIILLVILVIIAKYNQLITLLNKVKKSSSNIEVYLKKRFDLIPNFVECVKGYSNYEKETLEGIISLRNNYENKKDLNITEATKMNNQLNKYLAIVENYPELKANEQYLDLQRKLSSIEDELVHTRHIYNNEVTKYNILIEKVPSNIVASMFAFKKAELFQIDDDTRENVKIEL